MLYYTAHMNEMKSAYKVPLVGMVLCFKANKAFRGVYNRPDQSFNKYKFSLYIDMFANLLTFLYMHYMTAAHCTYSHLQCTSIICIIIINSYHPSNSELYMWVTHTPHIALYKIMLQCDV